MASKKFNINLDDSAFTRERRPAVSLFKPSSKGGHGETSTAPQAAGQPLSYAQFVVQSKSTSSHGTACSDSPQKPNAENAFVPPEHGLNLKLSTNLAKPQPRTEGPAASNTTVSSLRQDEDLAGEKNKEDGEERNVAAHVLGSGNSIIVSPRQRGNPILKFVRNVPWEFGEVVPDYVLGRTTCALFLSLRYHNLNPNYIHERLKTLGQTFMLRVLLVQVDVKDPHHALKELARICVMADCTLILAWSPEEAGRYLETYKSYEKKPADLLKEQVEKDYMSKVTDCLTTVKSINKTDVVTLLSTFSSLEGIINASKEELVLCPGLGPQKARRLYDVLHQPFLMSKTKES